MYWGLWVVWEEEQRLEPMAGTCTECQALHGPPPHTGGGGGPKGPGGGATNDRLDLPDVQMSAPSV
eukprot:1933367-Amphidinium_carterae.1